MNNFILKPWEQGIHCQTCWPIDVFTDSWDMLKQDKESIADQDKGTFLVSVFFYSMFSIMLADLLRETGKITMEKKPPHAWQLFMELLLPHRNGPPSWLIELWRSCRQVERPSPSLCVPMSSTLLITVPQLSVFIQPWLRQEVTGCTSHSLITMTAGHHLPCSR